MNDNELSAVAAEFLAEIQAAEVAETPEEQAERDRVAAENAYFEDLRVQIESVRDRFEQRVAMLSQLVAPKSKIKAEFSSRNFDMSRRLTGVGGTISELSDIKEVARYDLQISATAEGGVTASVKKLMDIEPPFASASLAAATNDWIDGVLAQWLRSAKF